MARRQVRLDGKSEAELRRLQKDLHRFSQRPVWDKKIKKELASTARSAEAAVKAKILAIPSKGLSARRGRESLRRKMYRAVRSDVDTSREYTGAFIWVDAYSMPSGEKNLPAYMERVRRYGRWRHQVYGHESVWVTQKAHPYFYRTLRPWEKEATDVGEKVLDEARREMEK